MRRRPLTKNPYYLLLIPVFLIVIGQMSTKYGATYLNESSVENSYLGLNLFIMAGYFCLVVRGGVWGALIVVYGTLWDKAQLPHITILLNASFKELQGVLR